MNNLNFDQQVAEAAKRIQYPEQMLGKELLMPCSSASSGARKLLFSTHLEHRMPLLHPEVPIISTGFENRFGKYSSSYLKASTDAEVIAKIPKFSKNPMLQYYMIILGDDGVLDVIERIPDSHITETYGFLYNNQYIDYKKIGSRIHKSDVIRKSASFDEYDNHMSGVNLRTVYLACAGNTEDAVLISESAAKKFTSLLIKKLNITVNDNDILLNLYGDDNNYKVFPDIGEDVKGGILAAIRRENKDESLFNQSYDRLKTTMMSDERYTIKGKVIDIDVYCNNIENLNDSIYNEQLKYYWNEKLRCASDIVNTINNMWDNGYTKMSYDLQKLYDNSKKALNGAKFSVTKPFSNIGIDITVMEELPLNVGDKITNRYGGKGVCKIIPDEKMPRTQTNEVIDIIYNQATGTNRLNMSQFFEQEINNFSSKLIEWLSLGANDEGMLDIAETVDAVLKFIEILSPKQADYYKTILSSMTDEEVVSFLSNIGDDSGILLSMRPVSDAATIDTLEKLMKAFPFIHPYTTLKVYIEGSDGKPRYIDTMRPVIVGHEYLYRLKQYAEEKFSTTSLSSTNIRGENSRSKAAAQFKDPYTNTPVRMGEMETMNGIHLGEDAVAINNMLLSASPSGRRRAEELLTNPTIEVDIKLGTEDMSRIVETNNAYFKTIGLALVFDKIPKIKPIYSKILYTKPVLRELYRKNKFWLPGEDPFVMNKYEDRRLKTLYIKRVPVDADIYKKYTTSMNPEKDDRRYFEEWNRLEEMKHDAIDLSRFKTKTKSD